MTFSYDKLWIILESKNMKKEDLRKITRISSATIAKLGKNQNVNMESIGKICKVLNCDIGEIVSYKRENE